jgi:hypothetical protein
MHKLNGYFQISLAVSRIGRLILPHSLDDVLTFSHRNGGHRDVTMTFTSQIKAPFSDILDKFTDLPATVRSCQVPAASTSSFLPRGITALARP